MKFALLLLFLPAVVLAQDTTQSGHTKLARGYVTAYNKKDYKKMFHIFPEQIPSLAKKRKKEIEKDLRERYKKQFAESGKMLVDSVFSESHNEITVKFHYQKDGEKAALMTYFDSKGNMQGVADKPPDFSYPHYPRGNAGRVLSASGKFAKIDSLLEKKFLKDHFNGAVMVIDDGQMFKKTYGYADFEKKQLLNDSSVFELASCSKQFTAMGIMMLAEQGELSYSDTVEKFIPDFPYHHITIENLLTHTSGLPDYMRELEEHWDKKLFATNSDIIEAFKKDMPEVRFLPNEKYQYSNTGYAMLSVIIEKASGMTYNEFLKKHIFEPLGMHHSQVYNTRRSKNETIANYAYGYVYSDSLKKYILPDSLAEYDIVRYLDCITGDGSVNTTISDLALWDKAIRDNTLVKKETLDKAYSKHLLNGGKESSYGYGEFIQNAPESEPLIYHSGGWPGYHTFILHFMRIPKTIVILSNNEYGDISKLADKVASIIISN